MGTYRFDDARKEKKKEMPAGWRGIGCLLMMILPVFSYLAAIQLLRIESVYRLFYRMSPGLFGAPSLHPYLWKLKGLTSVLNTIHSWTNLEANLVVGVLVLIVFSVIIGIVYGFMYRAVAPPKYGPTDAPPPKRRKTKKYSR